MVSTSPSCSTAQPRATAGYSPPARAAPLSILWGDVSPRLTVGWTTYAQSADRQSPSRACSPACHDKCVVFRAAFCLGGLPTSRSGPARRGVRPRAAGIASGRRTRLHPWTPTATLTTWSVGSFRLAPGHSDTCATPKFRPDHRCHQGLDADSPDVHRTARSKMEVIPRLAGRRPRHWSACGTIHAPRSQHRRNSSGSSTWPLMPCRSRRGEPRLCGLSPRL